jgi:NSS family neurotransmitter:Na+ symporter
VVLAALGQAFFSLSLGLAGMMAYGAYLPRDVSIPQAGIAIAGMDTAVALLAGLAIFPIVFAFNLDPAGGGPGLIFTVLPMAFSDMWGGALYGVVFFLLLMFAAWTSSISLLEPPTAYLVERTRLKRGTAAVIGGVLVWAIGIASLLGFNVWSEVKFGERDIQGAIEFVASDLMLPLGGLLIALYAGWVLDSKITRAQLPQLSDGLYALWRWSVRVVAPLLVLWVLWQKFVG